MVARGARLPSSPPTSKNSSPTPGRRPQVGVLLRNRPPHVATVLGVLMAGATLVVINPSRGDERTRADISALDLPVLIGAPDDVAALVTPSPRTTVVTITELDEPPVVTSGHGARHRLGPPRCRRAHAHQRNHGPAQADRPHLRHARAQCDGRRPVRVERTHRSLAAGSPSSTRRSSTSAASSACCSASSRPARSSCWRASNSTAGPLRSAPTGRAPCPWCPPHCGWCCTRRSPATT